MEIVKLMEKLQVVAALTTPRRIIVSVIGNTRIKFNLDANPRNNNQCLSTKPREQYAEFVKLINV